MSGALCSEVAVHGPRVVSCAMREGHPPPHFDEKLRIWWATERFEVPRR